MSSLFKSAKVIHDIESDLDYIEFTYERFVKGKGYETYVDHINTTPLANWTTLKSESQSIPFEKFLGVMCEKNLEVRQKMAELALENIMVDKQSFNTHIRTAYASKILDPTFQPPWINRKSAWQREFIKKFCTDTLADLIQRCKDESRLEYFFNVLNNIQSGQ
jgi:hypothetical protein